VESCEATWGYPPDKLLKPEETAEVLAVTLNTLRHWRTSGRGPSYVKLDGHFVRYQVRALRTWLERGAVNPLYREHTDSGQGPGMDVDAGTDA